jgi:hypothetical protein
MITALAFGLSAACQAAAGLGVPKPSFIAGVPLPATARPKVNHGRWFCDGAGQPMPAIFSLPPGVTVEATSRWYDEVLPRGRNAGSLQVAPPEGRPMVQVRPLRSWSGEVDGGRRPDLEHYCDGSGYHGPGTVLLSVGSGPVPPFSGFASEVFSDVPAGRTWIAIWVRVPEM